MEKQDLKHAIIEALDHVMKHGEQGNGENPPVRHSKISKTIERVIPTAPYENITIKTTLEIDVEWGTPEELLLKARNFTNLVLDDYKKTESQVFSELNLAEKKAFPSEGMKKRLASNGSGTSKDEFDGI